MTDWRTKLTTGQLSTNSIKIPKEDNTNNFQNMTFPPQADRPLDETTISQKIMTGEFKTGNKKKNKKEKKETFLDSIGSMLDPEEIVNKIIEKKPKTKDVRESFRQIIEMIVDAED